MKIKHSIQIDGIDYTNKLLSVSDIDIGVRDLGFGYISDISVELVFDSSLLSVKGKPAIVGLLVDGKSYTYKGIVRNIQVKDNRVSLNISHELSLKKFKGLSRYYSNVLKESFIVPVLYGNGTPFKAKGISIEGPDNGLPPMYTCLIGNKNFSATFYPQTSVYIADNIYGIKTQKTDDVGIKYITFPDGNIGVEIWNASASNVILYVKKPCHDIYGYKTDANGNEIETYLGSHSVWINPKDYEKLKFILISGCISSTTVYTPTYYITQPISETFRFEEVFDISVSDKDNPSDIIEDILIKNDFPVSEKQIDSAIKLNFQSSESYKTVIQKVAEMGLLYVIPNLDNSFRIILAGQGSIALSLSEADFIENSFSISVHESEFDKLKLIWNSGENTNYYGTGAREKEYQADFIANQTSADNFANNYLLYSQKTMYVEFETPVAKTYLDLNIGDVISISYSKYGISVKNFQIIQKTIRENVIKFKCKEV